MKDDDVMVQVILQLQRDGCLKTETGGSLEVAPEATATLAIGMAQRFILGHSVYISEKTEEDKP